MHEIRRALEDDKTFIIDALMSHNKHVMPPGTPYHSIEVAYVVIERQSGDIVGGIIGKIYRKCLAIDILWVSDAMRHQGIGSELMARAEKRALREGCLFIHLDTFSFQAPLFYKALGFEIFGTLEGFENDVKRYYLKKDLINS
jgi:GNAT superfamily N-acetyltransferase